VTTTYSAARAAGEQPSLTSATVTDVGGLVFSESQCFAADGCALLEAADGTRFNVPLAFVSVSV